MSGILVSGAITLVPQILKTVECFARSSNPTNGDMAKYEFAIARGNYDHVRKKLEYIKQYLSLNIQIPEVQLTETEKIDRAGMKEFCNIAMYIVREFDNYLKRKVIPGFCAEYFSLDIYDELKEIRSDPSSYDLQLKTFDCTQLDASLFINEMREFEPYMLNYGIGVSQDRYILVDRILNDSILALSRIHPTRLISPTMQFIILPRSAPKWIINERIIDSIHCIESSNKVVTVQIKWNSFTQLQLNRYKDLYNFKVHVRMETRQNQNNWTTAAEDYTEEYSECDYDHGETELKVKISTKYTTIQDGIRFYVKIIGLIDLLSITVDKVAKLHNMSVDNFTFGYLFTQGDYSLDDPIFSIDSIVNNVIGSSQFSLQTSLSICKAWQLSLHTIQSHRSNPLMNRYTMHFEGVDLLSLSAIGSHIIANKLFKNKSAVNIANLWSRVIRDLDFTRKYIFKTESGDSIINSIL